MSATKVLIVGGGAAGLVCAGFVAQAGAHVTVAERGPRCARKVLVTGKGRCNVTNNCTPEDFLSNVRTNPRFLYSALAAFAPHDTMAFFEQRGVPLKTERGNRVFPVSDKATDVAQALERFAKSAGARIVSGARVREIICHDGAVCGAKLENGKTLDAQAIVIACGGLSYPSTGSDGDGYKLAQALGHNIVPPRPSLVPIVCAERWCAELMGLSLKNVTLTLRDKRGKAVFSELGEMLFTHFGISGPLVLSASAYMRGSPADYNIIIDLKPGLDAQKLDARLLRDFETYKNRDFANALNQLLPRKLIPVVVSLSGIPAQQKVNEITRAQRAQLAALLKALPLTPRALRPVEEAVITAGGVDVRQVDPKTMQSKLVKGLYFAGEVLDVDAFTGGYNLQIAYSTAFLAACAIAGQVPDDGRVSF